MLMDTHMLDHKHFIFILAMLYIAAWTLELIRVTAKENLFCG